MTSRASFAKTLALPVESAAFMQKACNIVTRTRFWSHEVLANHTREQVSVEKGINLKVIWFDEVEDLLEVVFSCSNGFFSGQAEIYVGCDDLSEFADTLARFPSRPNDSRDFELGTFNPDHADGGARMHFFCADAAGHAVVEVKLRGDACGALGEMQSVALHIPIQAAGVDEFIKQLRGIGKTLGASAQLPQAAS